MKGPQEIADLQKHQGDRNACSICSPRSDRIRADALWVWSLQALEAWALRQPPRQD